MIKNISKKLLQVCTLMFCTLEKLYYWTVLNPISIFKMPLIGIFSWTTMSTSAGYSQPPWPISPKF
jgi:hypothetical protein